VSRLKPRHKAGQDQGLLAPQVQEVENGRRASSLACMAFRNLAGQDHPIMSGPSTTAATSVTCGNCSAATGGAHFCPACGKIQPLPLDTDYFAFFGLQRKLALDLPEFEQRFHALSWKLHPDNFMRASESERQLSLDRSSQLNDAYRTLRDPVARLEC